MIGDSTGRLRIHLIDRIRAPGRTSGLVSDVLVCTIEVGRHRSVRADLLLFQRPGLLRAINLLEVRDAGVLLARGPRFDEVRNRDGSQQADDGHHDHDFNEREPSSTRFHYLHLIPFWCERSKRRVITSTKWLFTNCLLPTVFAKSTVCATVSAANDTPASELGSAESN